MTLKENDQEWLAGGLELLSESRRVRKRSAVLVQEANMLMAQHAVVLAVRDHMQREFQRVRYARVMGLG